MAGCYNTGLILSLKGKYLICFFTNEDIPNFPVNDKETRPSKDICYGYLLPYDLFIVPYLTFMLLVIQTF